MLLSRLNENECVEEIKLFRKYINNLKSINDNYNLFDENS